MIQDLLIQTSWGLHKTSIFVRTFTGKIDYPAPYTTPGHNFSNWPVTLSLTWPQSFLNLKAKSKPLNRPLNFWGPAKMSSLVNILLLFSKYKNRHIPTHTPRNTLCAEVRVDITGTWTKKNNSNAAKWQNSVLAVITNRLPLVWVHSSSHGTKINKIPLL